MLVFVCRNQPHHRNQIVPMIAGVVSQMFDIIACRMIGVIKRSAQTSINHKELLLGKLFRSFCLADPVKLASKLHVLTVIAAIMFSSKAVRTAVSARVHQDRTIVRELLFGQKLTRSTHEVKGVSKVNQWSHDSELSTSL